MEAQGEGGRVGEEEKRAGVVVAVHALAEAGGQAVDRVDLLQSVVEVLAAGLISEIDLAVGRRFRAV